MLVIFACLGVLRYTESSYLRAFFVPVILLKVCGGIAVGLVFHFYYGFGDSITYFEESQILLREMTLGNLGIFEMLFGAEQFPFYGQPRAQFMLKIVTVLSIFALKNYYVVSVYLSILSALASWKLADTLSQVYQSRLAVLVAVLFLPSALFWGSGIMKESVALCMIYLLVNYILRILKLDESRISHYAWLIFGSVVLIKLKYYFAAILIPLIIVLLITYHLDRIYGIRRRLLVPFMLILLTVGVGGASLLHPNLQFNSMPSVVYNNHQAFLSMSKEQNIIKYKELEPTWSSLFSNAPLALISGLYRPFPSERGNIFKRIIGVGNLLLLLLTVVAFRQKWPRDKMTSLLLLAAIIYIAIEAIFLSLSTPNFGTLSRYKVGFMFLMVYLVLVQNPIEYWLDRKLKIMKWINR